MGGTIVCGVAETAASRTAGVLGARLGRRLVLVHLIDGAPATR